MRMTQDRRAPLEILIVDDNRGDAELTYEAFASSATQKRLHFVKDGEEALDFLYQRGNHCDAVRPHIILMDINMPRKTGKEVLATIKQDDRLKDIPVLMLTSSPADQDIKESYSLQANAYIVKPDTLKQLEQMVAMIEAFWLGLARLPVKKVAA